MTTPAWYRARQTATLADLGSEQHCVIEFQKRDLDLLAAALGRDQLLCRPAGRDALALVAARRALLAGRNMPEGTIMAAIRWWAKAPVPQDLRLEVQTHVTLRTDSRGRRWATAAAEVAGAEGPVADIEFRMLWPDAAP